MNGDPRFHAVLKEMAAMHEKKATDYGAHDGSDPLRNIRASADFGVPPWIGALVRLNDKVIRLQSFAAKGSLANESVEDSLLDIAVYAIISLNLYREESVAAEA